MAGWDYLVDTAGAVLLATMLYGVALVLRRRMLARHGGTFELSVRVRTGRPQRGWILGLGRYRADRLEWFRIFSVSPRPRRTWPRAGLAYAGRRDPAGSEMFSLYGGHVVVTCRTPSGDLELAMSPNALTGLQAWLEAGPPGDQGEPA